MLFKHPIDILKSFPNETISELGPLKKWIIWDYLGWAKEDFEEYSINEKWKLINIEWFLRICFQN